jgi:hypothetical protein
VFAIYIHLDEELGTDRQFWMCETSDDEIGRRLQSECANHNAINGIWLSKMSMDTLRA